MTLAAVFFVFVFLFIANDGEIGGRCPECLVCFPNDILILLHFNRRRVGRATTQTSTHANLSLASTWCVSLFFLICMRHCFLFFLPYWQTASCDTLLPRFLSHL